MHETDADMKRLQELLDLSIRQAGPFLKKSLQMPDLSLNAQQIVRYFQGMKTVALATSTSQGVPRVAPVVALFYRGEFYIPTVKNALRTRHVMQRDDVSLTTYEGTDFAVIVHGKAEIIDPENETYSILESLHRDFSGEAASDWGVGVYIRIDPLQFFSFARYPNQYPEFAGRR